MRTMVTLPTASELELFPYATPADSPLFSLDHAADISDALPDQEEAYRLNIPWHEIMGFLFAMADAHMAMLMQIDPPIDAYRRVEMWDNLERMQYRPSPLFRGLESLVAYEDHETALAVYNILTGSED